VLKTGDWARYLTLSSLVFLLAACAPAREGEELAVAEPEVGATASGVTALWETTDGIENPESVYVDAESGFIFSSQIVGDPAERDGIGRIVQLSLGGEVVSDSWVTGLNAPKGLRSHDGVLWTADLDEIIGIDIETATIVSRVSVEGAQFLNDVAIGDDGTVYVSDMAASRIYAVRDGEIEIFAEGENLEYPNGLLVEDGRLIVGAWGEPGPDFSTEVPGRLYALDLTTKEKTLITPLPFANIDGVESDGLGGYVITDFMAGKVMQVYSDGSVRDLAELGPGTADLGFIADEGLAIVPHMQENRVVAYDLSGMLR
jgi:sugar lactone lactonase YvrE